MMTDYTFDLILCLGARSYASMSEALFEVYDGEDSGGYMGCTPWMRRAIMGVTITRPDVSLESAIAAAADAARAAGLVPTEAHVLLADMVSLSANRQ